VTVPPALSPAVVRVEGFVTRRIDGWIRDLQELVRVPSPFEAERAITDLVEGKLRALGCPDVRRIPHDAEALRSLPDAVPPFSERPGRHSLVARVPGAGGGPTLAFNCHLDTAAEGPPATWTRPPFSGDIDDARRLHGRGAMDDKAGATLCLALADTLLNAPLRLSGDVLLQFVIEDEITGNGSLLCLEAGPRPDAALILDGTRPDRAIREHAGQLQCRLRVKGRPASVAVSHLGWSAAEMLAELALALKRDIHALNDGRQPPWDRFPSPFQCVLQRLRSDAPIFTLPEDASALLYVTFCPPVTLPAMRERITGFARDFAGRHAWPEPPEVGWGDYQIEPVRSAGDGLEPLIQASARAAGLGPVEVGPSTGTSDMRHFTRRGIPCLLYGPGRGFNPHRPDEYYELDDLLPMLRLYLDAAVRFCGAAPAG
jgi:acetylornithine deacetylase